jgi:nucleoside-diphosphate-sugar epimerase
MLVNTPSTAVYEPTTISDSVLVTGATGFIGPHLVTALAKRGAEVLPAGSAEAELGDPQEARRLLSETRPRTVVNLARPTHAAARAEDHAAHVAIAANLLTACREARVERLIQIGSATEFGRCGSPVDDDAPLRPTTPFGAAKARSSELVLEADGDGLRTVVLRPFSVYGPGDPERHLIPAAIEAAISGATLPLTGADVGRDWVFVADVAEACALAVDGRVDGEAVNVASGATVPNRRVVELVAGAAGREIHTKPGALGPRPWDAGIAGATERARRLLGWRASTGLADGIRRTVAARAVAR